MLLSRTPIVHFRSGAIASFVYMIAMCVFLLVTPISDIKPWYLYCLISINGIATGIAQTLIGNLGALYGGAGQVDRRR